MTTREFLSMVDGMVAKSITPDKHCCRKGCHHCCSEPLYVDEREADLMIENLTDAALLAVKSNTEKWVTKSHMFLDVEQPNALDYRRLNNPCPFLIGGLCSVYDVRPIGCRIFFAQANPENCAMPMRKHQKFAGWSVEQTAMVMLPFIKDEERIVADHLGVFLAEKLLGMELKSASRMDHAVKEMCFTP